MQQSLFYSLVLNVSLLVLVATVLTVLRPLRMMLRQREANVRYQALLGVLFGVLSVSGTYTGLSFQGAVVNTRVVSTVAAGLVGGPVCGLCAGLIGGVHRYFYDPTGFTSIACGVGTFCFGVIGAIASRLFEGHTRRTETLLLLTFTAEMVQCGWILLLAKPFSAAIALERAILLPKIIVNSAGLLIFMRIFDRLNHDLNIEMAELQSKALLIAQQCLPYLRDGGIKNRAGLQNAADAVRSWFPEYAVVFTDRNNVLAKSGRLVAEIPQCAREAMEENRLVTAQSRKRGDNSTVLAAPLHAAEQVIGSLMLFIPTGPAQVLDADAKTLDSLAGFFSVMLEIGEVEHQIALRQQAEFRALQSQINPHFLFNALNTISALCMTDPNRACEVILVLAKYFRQVLTINEPFVTLEQEISNVDNYLMLTDARFEGALHLECELPEDLTILRLPPLILQPIVENAVRHGFISVDNRPVSISIRQDEKRAYIAVRDCGKGFPPDVLRKLEDPDSPIYTGLFNVRKRLRSIYGDDCVFTVESTDHGSTVAFSIPLIPPRTSDDGEQEVQYENCSD